MDDVMMLKLVSIQEVLWLFQSAFNQDFICDS